MPSEIHISQIELIGAILKHLDRQCGIEKILPRQYNTIIRCVNEIIAEMQIPEKTFEPGCGAMQWLQSDRTGVSSLTMAHVMACIPRVVLGLIGSHFTEAPHPLDPADFGRCLGFLEACPEYREKLPMMRDVSREWGAIVDHWDEMESLYRKELPTGRFPKLSKLMNHILS